MASKASIGHFSGSDYLDFRFEFSTTVPIPAYRQAGACICHPAISGGPRHRRGVQFGFCLTVHRSL